MLEDLRLRKLRTFENFGRPKTAARDHAESGHGVCLIASDLPAVNPARPALVAASLVASLFPGSARHGVECLTNSALKASTLGQMRAHSHKRQRRLFHTQPLAPSLVRVPHVNPTTNSCPLIRTSTTTKSAPFHQQGRRWPPRRTQAK